MIKLPDSFKSYFWDVDFSSLNLENSRVFILKRLLDRGDTNAILWVKKHYSLDEIKNLLLSSRDLSQKSAIFWADYLGLDSKNVLCLQKPYSQTQFGLSS